MRVLRRIGSVLLLACIAFIILLTTVLLQDVDPEQTGPEFEVYSFPDTLAGRAYDLDSLKAIIGNNKILPPGFEVAAAIACSAFPELKDVNIEMVLTPGGAPMEATVDVSSLFGSREDRRYKILLNDAKGGFFDPILLRALPFDAQVGVIAHELGHVVYYHKLNLLQFGKWGLKYLRDDEFRAIHERSTDLMPVYYGLGSQIYQYAWFVRHDPSTRSLYDVEKKFMDKYYLTDEELRKIMSDKRKN